MYKIMTRTFKLDKKKREAILKRYGKPIIFWRETGLSNALSSNALYRAFRGEPINFEESTAINSAWTRTNFLYFDGVAMLEILDYGVQIAKKFTKVPLSRRDLLDNLIELDKREPV